MTELQRQGKKILRETFKDRERLMAEIRGCNQDWRHHWELLKNLGVKIWEKQYYFSRFARTFYPEYYKFCKTLDCYDLREL